MTDVLIVGGGASGLACAIELKHISPHLSVTILEKLPKAGKKILATGNGRCNLSNNDMNPKHYLGDANIATTILNSFNTNDCLNFFSSIGLITTEEYGRIYPLSMTATSVLSSLLIECKNLGVEIITDEKVDSVTKDSIKDYSTFTICTDKNTYNSRICILALGGKASAINGTDGDGYKLLKSLNIKYEPICPALVQIRTDEEFTHNLKGVRIRGTISLILPDEEVLQNETGEILFTDYGISGIAAMQLSSNVAQITRNGIKPKIRIDLCPSMTEEQIANFLKERVSKTSNLLEALIGMLNEKIATIICELSSHSDTIDDQYKIASKVIKGLTLTASGTNSYKDAQVTHGGVSSVELNTNSLESNKVPGLLICGELLNVDGLCGGYNLHFAWGSGIYAAKEAAKLATN